MSKHRKKKFQNQNTHESAAPRRKYGLSPGVALIVFLLILGTGLAFHQYGFHIFSKSGPDRVRIDAALPDIEFQGRRILFHMPSEKFLALSYEDRVELLSDQIARVVDYVKTFTGNENIVDIVSCIRPTGPRTLSITTSKDREREKMLNDNFTFCNHVNETVGQQKIIRAAVELLNKGDSSPDFDLETYKKKLSGFSDTDFFNLRLSRGSKGYIQRAMIDRDIVLNVVGDMHRPDAEKIGALLDWVFVNVSNHFERNLGRDKFNDYNDIPLELMLRGYGACDRSALVLDRLAWHAGLDAHIVYLYRSMSADDSFHTVSEVKVDGFWKVVDPFNNLIYDQSALELSRRHDDFKNCQVMLNDQGAAAFLPIMCLADVLCRMHIPDQKLFHGIDQAIEAFVNDNYNYSAAVKMNLINSILNNTSKNISLALDPDPLVIGRWSYPFWLRAYYYNDMYQLAKYKKYPFLKKLRAARLEQVIGHYDRAGELFAVLKTDPDTSQIFREDRDYFIALNHFYKKEYAEVEKTALGFRKNFQASPRNTMLNYVLAQSFIRLGRAREAVEIYPKGRNFQGRGSLSVLPLGPQSP